MTKSAARRRCMAAAFLAMSAPDWGGTATFLTVCGRAGDRSPVFPREPGFSNERFVAHRRLWGAVDRLCGLGGSLGVGGRPWQCPHAGDRRRLQVEPAVVCQAPELAGRHRVCRD